MNNWLKNNAHLVAIMVINLLALILLSGLWWWQYNLVSQIQTLTSERATSDQRRQQLSNLRNLVERTATDRQALNQHFVTPDSLPDFIEQVERLELKHKVDLNLTSVTVVTKPAEHLNFKIDLKGPREALLQLITELLALPYRLSLDSGSLQLESSDAAAATWSADLSVDLLSYDTKANISP